MAALPDDTNLSTRTSSAPLASAIPHTTRWLSPLQDAPAPSTSWALQSSSATRWYFPFASFLDHIAHSFPRLQPALTTSSTPLTSCFTSDYIFPQSSNLLAARADSFVSQTRQNLVKVVALVYPPRRLSPAASTFDISPFKITAPATFIDPCNRSISFVKHSRQA